MYKKEFMFIKSMEKFCNSLSDDYLDDVYGKIEYIEKTSKHDLLTEMDIKIEKLISDKLSEFDGSIPRVGEESGGSRNHYKYWLIDPIDGTIHFVRGNPFCSIMVSLVYDGRPIACFIYNIRTRDFSYAAKGMGAFCGDSKLQVLTRSPEQAVVLTEFGPGSELSRNKISDKFRVVNFMCAGYEFDLVAKGSIDARIIVKPVGKDYDFAPGILLVSEAGGVVLSTDRSEYLLENGGDFIVANSMEVYDAIMYEIEN